MALKNLKAESDALEKTLRTPKGQGSSANPFRKQMNTHVHTFKFSEAMIKKELLQITNKFDAAGKRLHSGTPEYKAAERSSAMEGIPDAEINNFVKSFMTTLKTKFPANRGAGAKVKYTVSTKGKTMIIVAVGSSEGSDASVYNAIQTALSSTQKQLQPQFKKIFERASQFSKPGKTGDPASNIFNVGHDVGVAIDKFAAIDSILNQIDSQLGDVAQVLQDKTKTVKSKFPFFAGHNMQLDFRGGKIISKLDIGCSIESWHKNMVDNVGAGDVQAGNAILKGTKKTEPLIKQLQDVVEKELKKTFHDPSNFTGREYSTPMLTAFGEMITNQPTIKRLQRRGQLKNLSKYKRKPKSKPRIKAKKNIPVKTKKSTGKPKNVITGMKKLNLKRGPTRPATEKGDSLASLYALLNAKLPRTVAENMGAPGLENRTGTFASSVRVTDVSRTAQGHPSIGYTYQRNPYQIFETGTGTPPWATPARDPRTLVDASIREIAQELAVGRFYTRRV